MSEDKTCIKCGLTLPALSFANGRNICKDCRREQKRASARNSAERLKPRRKEFYNSNKERILEEKKEYYLKHRGEILERHANLSEDQKKTRSKKECLRYHSNAEEISNRRKMKRLADKKAGVRRPLTDRERRRARMWNMRRRHSDPLFAMKMRIRNLVRRSFRCRGLVKSSLTESIVGMTSESLYYYLIDSFVLRYGYYPNLGCVHIDHIIPISTANGLEEVHRLNHYTNLQLLRAEDNLIKSDRLDWV